MNLLVAFQALFQTNSVSLAAQRCFVSQSAMSHTLQRMRVLFDDPLFDRVGTSMEPTQRAQDIAPVIDQLLASIKYELLIKKHFSAVEYAGVWKIGLTDYAEQLFAPMLYDSIKQASPNSQVSFFNVNRSNYVEIVEQEELDVVIGSIDNVNRRFLSQHLYTEQHLCLFDPNTIHHGEAMTLDEFVSYEHALVSPDGRLQTQVDQRLHKLGYERRVGVASRNFLTIRRLLIGRPLLCIVPKRFAEMERDTHAFMAISPPIAIPDFDISLLFLKAHQHEEKSLWIRQQVMAVVS
nr:LysR family transcriptional regulator [Vibrio sp. JPW-9-11-11]